MVKDGTRVHIIPVERLDYAEAQDDYVALHSQGKSYLKQQTISSLEATLDPEQFIRIHRSSIVNIERVARIEPYTKDSRMAVLADGTQLPVSRGSLDAKFAVLASGMLLSATFAPVERSVTRYSVFADGPSRRNVI